MVITECSSIVLTVKPNGGVRNFVDVREWIPKKVVDITGYKHPPFLRYSILFLWNRKAFSSSTDDKFFADTNLLHCQLCHSLAMVYGHILQRLEWKTSCMGI
jgi:hypothetical protein